MAGIPSLNQLRNFAVNRAGAEGIRQTLFDHLLYPAAGTAQLLFFSQPKGQGVTTAQGAAVGGVKSIADTNMELSGQLAAGKAFCATSIEAVFYAGSSAAANTFALANPAQFNAVAAAAVAAQVADVNAFYQSGSLRFFIGSKAYLEEAPLMRFPPKVAFQMDAALSTNSATVGEIAAINAKAVGRPYMLEPQILLENGQNFAIELNYPGAVAMPSGFNARVGIILDGYLYRNSQ